MSRKRTKKRAGNGPICASCPVAILQDHSREGEMISLYPARRSLSIHIRDNTVQYI